MPVDKMGGGKGTGWNAIVWKLKAPIAVIEVAPTGKTSFVYTYVQTRLKGQYNGK